VARGVSAKITVNDSGLRRLMSQVKDLEGDPHVRVGIFSDGKGGEQHDESGLSNVELAVIHEFGAPEAGIPERSFIRSTFSKERAALKADLKVLLKRVLEGKLEARAMFDLLGQRLVAAIQRRVRGEGIPPPLKQATIDRKGSSRPLIDTGRMMAALTYATFIRGEKGGR